jgi:conjugal transfer pilus assembly protein TraW
MLTMRHKKITGSVIRLICCMVFCMVSSYAKDLGVWGEIYPIAEEDLLNFILHRIETMQKNGEWQALQNQFRDKVAKHADRPQPISFLTKTTEAKNWEYDPSITVPYDLKDVTGKVFVKAGTIVNPLRFVMIHKVLLFFDGDDKDQVAWAEKFMQKRLRKVKLILVNGSVSDQVNYFHQPIYFDQAGRLITRFHIQHVPAVVVQEGLHLKISEIVL